MKNVQNSKGGILMCKEAICEIKNKKYTIDNVYEAAQLILNSDHNNAFLGKDGSTTLIVKIVNESGFSIFAQELDKKIGGFIIVDERLEDNFDTDKIIVVNRDASVKRRRFTLAHEFGHYLFDFKNDIHSPSYKNVYREDDDTTEQPAEQLANRFAAEILMPKNRFEEEWYQLTKGKSNVLIYDIAEALSNKFLVPIKAVYKRFNELKLDIRPGAGVREA